MLNLLKLLSLIVILLGGGVICSCNNYNDIKRVDIRRPQFTKFYLAKEHHSSLTSNYYGTIIGDSVELYCPDLQNLDSVFPSFEGVYSYVKVNDIIQTSGQSSQNFDSIVKYELIDSIGNSCFYSVCIKGLNNIPRVDVNTEGGVGISSRTEYIPAKVMISNCPEYGKKEFNGKIKGHGNSTWGFPKSPYKLKFSEKQSPFGFPANKDWVLLAEANDRSLLRTVYMCELSKAADIDYTINYQHVDLYINGVYWGCYLFTDQVEKAQNRVQLEKDGFLIEDDNYYKNEPLYFFSSMNYPYTFKYPNAGKSEIVEGDENYRYITNFMNNLEQKLRVLKLDSLNTDYLDYLDNHSFAKTYLVLELLLNYDPNMYYVLHSRNAKLMMMPLWDAEWSLGLWPLVWGNPPQSMHLTSYWNVKRYFKYLFMSQSYIETLIKEWYNLKRKIPQVRYNISIVCNKTQYALRANLERWPEPSLPLNVRYGTWEEEVSYIKFFFDKRVEWLDSCITSWGGGIQ